MTKKRRSAPRTRRRVLLEPVDEPAQTVPDVEAAARLQPRDGERRDHEGEEDVEVLLGRERDGRRERGERQVPHAARREVLVEPEEQARGPEEAPRVVPAEARVVEEVRRERAERARRERRAPAEPPAQEEGHRRERDARERRGEARREVGGPVPGLRGREAGQEADDLADRRRRRRTRTRRRSTGRARGRRGRTCRSPPSGGGRPRRRGWTRRGGRRASRAGRRAGRTKSATRAIQARFSNAENAGAGAASELT